MSWLVGVWLAISLCKDTTRSADFNGLARISCTLGPDFVMRGALGIFCNGARNLPARFFTLGQKSYSLTGGKDLPIDYLSLFLPTDGHG